MLDLTDPRLLWLKAGLFIVCGVTAALLLILEQPTVRMTILLAVSIWCFCRAYYFAFYVIERYLDSSVRIRGLIDGVQTLHSQDNGSLNRSR